MKNIVICCDGTGNEYGANNTNVVETYAVARKTNKQIVFYDPGVGTGGWEYAEGKKPGEDSITALKDQATGHGLQKNVNDAYAFLMETYESGDRVYLFGFSRGAFTVRSLAGMLHKVGLLRSDNDNLVEYAAKLYNIDYEPDDDDKGGSKVAADAAVPAGFKATFGRACPVHFVGVWDTVSSLIMNAGRLWHDATLNAEVKHGYHALAIDERRKDFPPAPWDESAIATGQTIEQVWFPGVHSDVGGWYDERGLSNGALHWMLGHAKDKGMDVDADALGAETRRPDPHGLDAIHESKVGLWRLRGTHTRKIPEGSKVHVSAFERRTKASNKYHPKNLLPKPKYEVIE